MSAMTGFAVIRKDLPNYHLDQAQWLAVMSEFTELRRTDMIKVGAQRFVFDGSAIVVQEGRRPAFFLFDNGLIHVVGPYSLFPMAQAIARKLGARVFNDAGEELLEAPTDHA